MTTSNIVEGEGTTLEKAMEDAVNKVPSKSGADIMVVLKVESFGTKTGGFANVHNFWVKASYNYG